MKLPLAIVMWIIFLSIKYSSEVIEKLRLRNVQGSQVSSFDFLLYTHHCHMILTKQKCCLLLNGVSIESQKLTSVRFVQQEMWLVYMLDWHWVMWSFYFPHGPPRWCRGSGLVCGSKDPGSIPGIPSPRVGPLMVRRLKTSSDVPVPKSGYARHAKDP